MSEAGEAVASRAPIPRGRLRVGAPVVFSHVVLARIGARFALAHPLVQLEIVADDRVVDPVEEGYDLVIRIDPAKDDRLVGRLILHDQRLIVARAEVPCPAVSTDTEVPVAAVVTSATPPAAVWQVRREGAGGCTWRPEPILKLSSLLMVRQAVLSGIGAALLPKLLVAEDIEAGRLVCWGTEDGPGVEIWALYSSRRLLSAKVRAFVDALIQSLSHEKSLPP